MNGCQGELLRLSNQQGLGRSGSRLPLEAEVSAPRLPAVGDLQRHGSRQADAGCLIGKDPTTLAGLLISLSSRSWGLVE